MFYRPEDRDHKDHGLSHNPFKALVSPRPIAWVSTVDAEGRVNLAPFSYFNAVNDAPPILMLAFNGPKSAERREKDTLANILGQGEFVVNLVSSALKDHMNVTAAIYPADVDEFERAGLEKAPSQIVAPPRVAASPAAFECRLLSRHELPVWSAQQSCDVVFGEVVGVHIDDGVVKDGKVDVAAYQPLARLGYMDYAAVEAVFPMPRPKAAD